MNLTLHRSDDFNGEFCIGLRRGDGSLGGRVDSLHGYPSSNCSISP